jgi:hypothetical protein
MSVLAGDLRSRPWATLSRSSSWPASLVSASPNLPSHPGTPFSHLFHSNSSLLDLQFPPRGCANAPPTRPCFYPDLPLALFDILLILPSLPTPLSSPNLSPSLCSFFPPCSYCVPLLLAVSTGFLMFDSFDFYDIWEPQSHCWDTCCLPTGKCTLEVCELHKADMGERDKHCRLAHSFGESESFPTCSVLPCL